MLAMLSILSACGSTNSSDATGSVGKTETGRQPTSLILKDDADRDVVFEVRPQTVAVLSTGDMNIIHDLDGNLVGRPSTTLDLPETLQSLQQLGNTHQPNIEQIAALAPDLLIAPSGFESYAPTLENQGMKVFISKANSINDVIKDITNYGAILGKQENAGTIVDSLQNKLAALKQQASNTLKQPTVLLVYGAPGTFLAALPSSLTGDIFAHVGVSNIAEQYPKLDQYPGYAQLSAERVIENNPDIVLLITHGDPASVETAFKDEMSKNPGWKNIDAVKQGRVSVLPPELFGVNPGSRLEEALDYAAKEIIQALEKP